MVKIIKPSFDILAISKWPLKLIEKAGRICYKSEDKIGWSCPKCRQPGVLVDNCNEHGEFVDVYSDCGCNVPLVHSSVKFAEMIMKREHLSVIEHGYVTVLFISNRGFTHELVRHRLTSPSQESTRYCNYTGNKFRNELTIIKPWWKYTFPDAKVPDLISGSMQPVYDRWSAQMRRSEGCYKSMIECGLPPQAARGVLPIDVKTEIVITANLREWRHIFKMRASPAAHPDMQRLMYPLLEEFKKRIPVIYDDLPEKAGPFAWSLYPDPTPKPRQRSGIPPIDAPNNPRFA